jgi:hypothetical protein
MENPVIGEPRTAHSLPALLSHLFARNPVAEKVSTRVHFASRPEAIWNEIIFYEEVPGHAPLPLRWFMPAPVRTVGAKSTIGAKVRCIYQSGHLVKRITVLDSPCLLRFQVVEQHLGIEGCAIAKGGSYEIYHSGDETDIVLTTRYHAFLHPRWLWRPFERLIAHQLHRHVLNGMRAAMKQRDSAAAICHATPQEVADRV